MVMILVCFQENPVFSLKNIKPINNGRLIISGAGSFYSGSLSAQYSATHNTHNTLLEGMEETTLKVIGWQGDMFKGTNVSKVGDSHH